MGKIILYLKNFDWLLFSGVLLLACFGLAEIYSIALGQGALNLLNFKKQVVFIIIGIACLFLFSFLDYNFIKKTSKYFYALAIASLLGVLFFGTSIRGTKGWFDFGFINLQPAEFAKIALIIILAYFFSSRAIKIRSLKQLLLSGIICLTFIIPIFMQPDFGSALIVFSIWLLMLFWAGFNKKYFIILTFVTIIIAGGLWMFSFKDYQKERVLTLINPAANSLDRSYNITQAIIAVGSGGLIGRGIGFGSQSQLKFLPEAQNDFIFAVISEELGFLGVILIFLFYGIIFYRCFVSIPKISNDFAIFSILGVVGLIFIQMFINISMNIGLLPVVGISLPFTSYGGSSIISSFILIGIVENIIIKSKLTY